MNPTISFGQLRQNVKIRIRELNAIHLQIEESRTRRCEIENQLNSEVRKYITTRMRHPQTQYAQRNLGDGLDEAWEQLGRFKALAEKKRQEITIADIKLQDQRKRAQAREHEALERYGKAACKRFCSLVQLKLPRELRDMVYDSLIESEEDWWKIMDQQVDIDILDMEALTSCLESRFPFAVFYHVSYMGEEIRNEVAARWRWKYEGAWSKGDEA